MFWNIFLGFEPEIKFISYVVGFYVTVELCAMSLLLQACAFTEAKLKMSDVTCALTLCSVLHQRYADFAPSLLEHWQKVLLSKKDDKVSYDVN